MIIDILEHYLKSDDLLNCDERELAFALEHKMLVLEKGKYKVTKKGEYLIQYFYTGIVAPGVEVLCE